jgi:hypothetical protein
MSKSQEDFDAVLIEIEKTCKIANNGKDWDIEKASKSLSLMEESGRITESEEIKILNYIEGSKVVHEKQKKQEELLEVKKEIRWFVIIVVIGVAHFIITTVVNGGAVPERLERTFYESLATAVMVTSILFIVSFVRKKMK